MTESEMLEYAAGANGYIDDATTADDGCHDQIGLHKGVDGVFYLVRKDGWGPWAPRTNSGHAFELAMRAGITVRQMAPYVYALGKTQHQARFDDAGDMMAAAREAVFMAAAELGKAMP